MKPEKAGEVVPLTQILRQLSPGARIRLLWRLMKGRGEFVLFGGSEEDELPTEPLPDTGSWGPLLVGRSIHRVSYSVIAGIEWEVGAAWHHVGVAVELTLDDNTGVTVFAHPIAGIRVTDRPAREIYSYNPTPDRERDVTNHPRWRPLIAAPVRSVDVPMSEPVRVITSEPARLPLAVHLSLPQGDVWIAAAESTPWEESGFTLLSDCVIVVFEAALAEAMGLIPNQQ